MNEDPHSDIYLPTSETKNGSAVCTNGAGTNEQIPDDASQTPQQPGNEQMSTKNKKIKYTIWDVICVFISLFTYMFDQVTDLVMAVWYYQHQYYWFFGFTLAFVIIPSLTMTIFSLTWYIQDHKENARPRGSRLQWLIRAICLFLNCGPILRYFESLCYGCKLLRKKDQKKESYFYIMIYEDTDASLLRLFECFMESAPQLVLQIYILVKNDIPESVDTEYKIALQAASIVTSLISLSWAIASYNRSLRFSMDEKMKLTWLATIFQFFWRFFNITARVLSLALFASAFGYWVFVAIGIHWLIMSVWIITQKTEFCNRRWEEVFFDMVMGTVYIFCFLNVKDEPTRYKTAAYHLLMVLEGTVFMVSWYLGCDPTVWYHLPALLAFYACFSCGMLLMIIYYLYYHPQVSFRSQVSVNGDMPDHIIPSVFTKSAPEKCKKLSRRTGFELSTVDEKVKL